LKIDLNIIPIPYLFETVAFLLTVVVIVPLFKRINVSPILGYLAVGALIGPHSLSIVSNVEDVSHVAELGIVFLLFTIGLELSFERLRSYRRLIFGLGAAQVIASTTVIGAVAYYWGNSAEAALIIGLCLALSSTAMVMQLLTERDEVSTSHGRASFSVLLFQDLAVVPILILLPVLAAENNEAIWLDLGLSLLKAAIAIGVILLLGRLVFRRLFHIVAGTRNVDVFTAMILLSVLATSLLTAYAGLSLTLGAFLAGLLLAETEFRHQIESEVMPFKGLLLGLFFMSVGMMLDFSLVIDQAGLLILALIGLIVLKSIIGIALARFFGLQMQDALRVGLYLSEAGEFAFVLIGQAMTVYNLIPVEIGQFMVILAGLSMVLTPFLVYLAGALSQKLSSKDQSLSTPENGIEGLSNHVIIAGYGRVGKSVASILKQQSIDYVALDLDADSVRHSQISNDSVYYGDAARADVLKQIGADYARIMLITLDEPLAALRIVEVVKERWPDLTILVRARDAEHTEALYAHGADAVMPETIEASLQLAAMVLERVDVDESTISECLDKVRDNGYKQIKTA
jgi:CPA2 family monovalent cation:H+ antiporter-2